MRTLFLAAGLALAACGPATPPEPAPDPRAAEDISDTVQALPHRLPPADAEPRFVGSWATTGEGCDDPAWIINAHEMHTRGEVSCSFGDVSEIRGGYNVLATCTEQGPPTPYTMQITFAESAQAMMIAGGPWSPDPGLLYCGPAP